VSNQWSSFDQFKEVMGMSFYDYTNTKKMIHDTDIIELLCFDTTFEQLLDRYTGENFLKVDERMQIPFFAEIRDYKGAVEVDTPENKWLIKAIQGRDIVETGMAMIAYFIDFFTGTLSVPIISTEIDGVLYKATKMITKAEQLSGANYTVYPELYEQLLLDIINRWITYDEDRNPNNYLIRYNSKNRNLILAIDFGNCDLLFGEMKIKGLVKQFGWQRTEKTRYLTPLKTELFLKYPMEFYNMRFNRFRKLTREILTDLSERALRFDPDRERNVNIIPSNVLRRINYVHGYFNSKIPKEIEKKEQREGMGNSFR